MDLIAELSYVLRAQPPKSFKLLIPKKSKLRRLYAGVLRGKVTDEASGIAYLYPTETIGQRKKYQHLQRNLIRKLSELVLISDAIPSFQPAIMANRQALLRQIRIAEKLLQYNVYHNAERLAAKAVRQANDLALPGVAVEGHRLLRDLYAVKGNIDLTAKHQALHLAAVQRYQAEEALQGTWLVTQSHLKYGIGRTAARQTLLQDTLAPFTHATTPPSPAIQLTRLRVEAALAHQQADHRALAHHLQAWAALEAQHPEHASQASRLSFLLAQAQWYRDTQAWAEAEAALGEAVPLASFEAYTLFDPLALLFDVSLQQVDLDRSARLIQQVQGARQFQFLHPMDAAGWVLRQWLLEFARLVYQPQTPPYHLALGKLKLVQVHASLKAALPDRTGVGFLAQLVPLLLLVHRGVWPLEDEAEALRKYHQRHFQPQTEARTAHFVKQLALLMRGEDDPRAPWPSATLDICEWIAYPALLGWVRQRLHQRERAAQVA